MSRPGFPDFPESSALVAGRGEGVTGMGPEGTSAGEKIVYVHPVEESHQRPHLSQPTLVGCWPGSSDPEEEAGLPTSATPGSSIVRSRILGPTGRAKYQRPRASVSGNAADREQQVHYSPRLSLLGCDLGI